jgi:hypothetical protein
MAEEIRDSSLSRRGENQAVRLVRQLIQRGFEFHTFRLNLISFRRARNPYRRAPDKAAVTKRERDFKPIPTFKDFFFEAAKVIGKIGRPVSFASSITPAWA